MQSCLKGRRSLLNYHLTNQVIHDGANKIVLRSCFCRGHIEELFTPIFNCCQTFGRK